MSVIKFIRDIARYFRYPSDDQPTTQQDYQNAVKNWVATEESLVDSVLWQPTTRYSVGNVVKTPSIPSQYYLVCTTAGTSGNSEPTYTGVSVGDSVTDGSVTWKVSGYLPVTGGILSGYLQFSASEGRIQSNRTNYDGFVSIYGGGGYTTGAYLQAYGKSHATYPGYFRLFARDDTNGVKELQGRPDGTLTWGGNDIALAKDVLPLSGGTMTGNIFTNSADFRLVNNRTNNSGRLFFMGGNGSSAGASMALFGNGYGTANGYFSITANDGTDSKILVGRPNGSLTWDGNNIAIESKAKTATNTSNLSSSTSYTQKASLSLSAGTWLVCANVIFPSNATGVRALNITTGLATILAGQTNPAIAAGGATTVSASCITAFSETTSVQAMVFQNSGSTLNNVKTTITAQKLSDYTSFSA